MEFQGLRSRYFLPRGTTASSAVDSPTAFPEKAETIWCGQGDGDDCVKSWAGNDCLFGQEGQDRIHGGSDNDTIHGGDQADSKEGGTGADSIAGGAENLGSSDHLWHNYDTTSAADGGVDRLWGDDWGEEDRSAVYTASAADGDFYNGFEVE